MKNPALGGVGGGAGLPLGAVSLLQAAEVQRGHTCVNAHLGSYAVHGEALLLFHVGGFNPIEVSNFNGVGALRSGEIPSSGRVVVQARFGDNLRHALDGVGVTLVDWR